MRKTGIDIEIDFYGIVKTALSSYVSGRVYRKGTRPLNSQTEDILVAFVGGIDGQTQEGVVNVNWYVSNIDNNSGAKVPDLGRIKTVSHYLQTFIEGVSIENYDLWLDAQIQAYAVADTEQHCVNLRVAYKRSTIND